jgi:hypothetical protein
MQYGATQLFERIIPAYLNADARTRILVTSTWANGVENFIPFFLSARHRSRVEIMSVNSFMGERKPMDAYTLMVMTPREYAEACASGKFQLIEVDRVVPYPDGRPGFYFARLSYAADFERKIAAEYEAHNLTVTETIRLGSEALQVIHSLFDLGGLSDLFDDNPQTLARGLEANPLVLEFSFAKPRPLRGLRAVFGSMDLRLTASLAGPDDRAHETYIRDFRGLPPDPSVEMDFARGPALASTLRLEILKLDAAGDKHIHVRELIFR